MSSSAAQKLLRNRLFLACFTAFMAAYKGMLDPQR